MSQQLICVHDHSIDDYLQHFQSIEVKNYLKFLKSRNAYTVSVVESDFLRHADKFRDTVITKYLFYMMNETSEEILKLIKTNVRNVSDGGYFKPIQYNTTKIAETAMFLEKWDDTLKFSFDLSFIDIKLALIKQVIPNPVASNEEGQVVNIPKYMISKVTTNKYFIALVTFFDNIIEKKFSSDDLSTKILNLNEFDNNFVPVILGYVIESIDGCKVRFMDNIKDCSYKETCKFKRNKLLDTKTKMEELDDDIEFMVIWGLKKISGS